MCVHIGQTQTIVAVIIVCLSVSFRSDRFHALDNERVYTMMNSPVPAGDNDVQRVSRLIHILPNPPPRMREQLCLIHFMADTAWGRARNDSHATVHLNARRAFRERSE